MVGKRTPSSSPKAITSMGNGILVALATNSSTTQRREDAEIAVIFAGVANRVDVRSQHETGTAARGEFIASNHRRRVVDVDVQARLSHPLRNLVEGMSVLLQVKPCDAGTGLAEGR